jgi:hypothetical protein
LTNIILILKKIYSLLDIIKKESEKISDDIEGLRSNVKNKGIALSSFIKYVFSFLGNKKKSNNNNNN